jgi:hypothetical protein
MSRRAVLPDWRDWNLLGGVASTYAGAFLAAVCLTAGTTGLYLPVMQLNLEDEDSDCQVVMLSTSNDTWYVIERDTAGEATLSAYPAEKVEGTKSIPGRAFF